MELRFLGRTGVKVSRLCMGTMTFGGEADEATSAAIIRRCRDAGINFFDCADVYNKGRAEEIVGRLLRECRNQVVLATKAYFPTSDDANARGTSRYHLVRAAEASLRRLGTDRIDLYYLHRFDDATALEESLRGLELLVQRGMVLYPALSNFAAWQCARALGIAEARQFAPVVCVQPMYNLAKRQAEVEILPFCQAENIAATPYSPLGGGLLTGKYGSDQASSASDGRLARNRMYATRYGDPDNFAIAARLAQFARDHGYEPAALAIAWVAAHPAVTAPIIGARSVAQIDAALAALTIDMSPDLRAAVSALSPTPPPATDRNEEGSAQSYGLR
jgi:aryl-alcohol dehydrogenase-like predicted oxidoreductase